MKKRFGVISFPGSNCDRDCEYAIKMAGSDPVTIWHEDNKLYDSDCIIIPGGFSYGDYLRSGALASVSPIMNQVAQFAANGGLVLGICNGFQILVEAKLLPGALLMNESLRFVHKTVYAKIVMKTPFTYLFDNGSVLNMPIAHKEGRYYSNEDYKAVLRYCGQDGTVSDIYNPNGSIGAAAGIINENGNVCGIMPHPERASEEILGSDDGIAIFRSMAAWLLR